MAWLNFNQENTALGGLIHHNAQEETWIVALNSFQGAQDHEISNLCGKNQKKKKKGATPLKTRRSEQVSWSLKIN